MTKNSINKKFSMYLKEVIGNLSAREVAKRVQRLCPNNKAMQISQPYLTGILNGDKPPPSPPKLKALSLATGENYETMLFHAGYLDRDPTASPRTWDKETHLDLFLKSLTDQKIPEELKQALEKAFTLILEQDELIKNPQRNITRLTQDILKNAYLLACDLGPLSKPQTTVLHNNIDGIIQMARSWRENERK